MKFLNVTLLKLFEKLSFFNNAIKYQRIMEKKSVHYSAYIFYPGLHHRCNHCPKNEWKKKISTGFRNVRIFVKCQTVSPKFHIKCLSFN
jgi:hypothetical protein